MSMKQSDLHTLIDKRGPNECWPWMGGTNEKGYAKASVNGKCVRVARLICADAYGPAPCPNDEVLHSCDSNGCCNAAHLSWGTRSRNLRDKRDRLGTHGPQKLDRAAATKIKHEETGATKDVAAKYGISKSLVRQIRAGTRWADL
jgi:hypothetical protein